MNPLKVFISSTINDLSDQRDAIDESLSDTGVFEPVRVEKLAAQDNTSRHVCLREVAESDAVILLLGNKYGFVPDKKTLTISVLLTWNIDKRDDMVFQSSSS